MAHTGLVSVIPQPWIMAMSKRSWYASISDRGTAAPPAVTQPQRRQVDVVGLA